MFRWLIGGLLGLIGLAAVVAVVGYFVLKRDDVPYATLASHYENANSRYVDLPGGIHMHYRDEGAHPGDATVLLVHGYAASVQTWEPWVRELGGQYRVVSIDLPGHGLTSAPAGYQPTTSNYVDAINAFAASQHLDHFVLAGNSMGGNIAWHYALAHPEQLNALVLVDAGGWPDASTEREPIIFKLLSNPIIAPLLRDLDNTRLTREGLEKAFVNQALINDVMVSRYTDLARAPGHREILVRIMLDRASRDVATPERLRAIRTPTLIIHGDHDNLIAPSSGQHFKDAIPDSQLVMLPNVGHVPQEEAAAQSAMAVHEFLYALGERGQEAMPAGAGAE
jgi:pimeloyl-ACP methyl ester carboxylesterase